MPYGRGRERGNAAIRRAYNRTKGGKPVRRQWCEMRDPRDEVSFIRSNEERGSCGRGEMNIAMEGCRWKVRWKRESGRAGEGEVGDRA